MILISVNGVILVLRTLPQVSSDELFVLKEARHKVNSCIEHFISVNHLGCFVHSDGGLQAAEYGVPAGWDRFIECMNNHHNQPILNECGRCVKKGGAFRGAVKYFTMI